jgi:hypothetical protein
MAERLIPPGEKRGATIWVRCPGCAGWFHAAPELVAPDAPRLCCPHCRREFAADEAAAIARP